MKVKVVVFSETSPFFIKKMLFGILPELGKGRNVCYYSSSLLANEPVSKEVTVIDKQLEYFYKSKDYRIYKGVLDYCNKSGADTLFIPRLYQPEILLSELRSRKNNPRVVASIFGLQDVFNSGARLNTYVELLNSKFFRRLFVFSIAGDSVELPGRLKRSSKITRLFDPIYEDPVSYKIQKSKARKYLGFDQNSYQVLYFGLMTYGKGVDVLFEASKRIKDKDIKIVLASDPANINFDFSDTVFSRAENVEYRPGSVTEKDMFYYFSSADSVVLPYRKTYQNGTSGVLVQAALANKPLICPDIYPFADVCNKYKMGVIFKSENSQSLARAIELSKAKQKELLEKTQFSKYILNIQNWDYIADKIFN